MKFHREGKSHIWSRRSQNVSDPYSVRSVYKLNHWCWTPIHGLCRSVTARNRQRLLSSSFLAKTWRLNSLARFWFRTVFFLTTEAWNRIDSVPSTRHLRILQGTAPRCRPHFLAALKLRTISLLWFLRRWHSAFTYLSRRRSFSVTESAKWVLNSRVLMTRMTRTGLRCTKGFLRRKTVFVFVIIFSAISVE